MTVARRRVFFPVFREGFTCHLQLDEKTRRRTTAQATAPVTSSSATPG